MLQVCTCDHAPETCPMHGPPPEMTITTTAGCAPAPEQGGPPLAASPESATPRNHRSPALPSFRRSRYPTWDEGCMTFCEGCGDRAVVAHRVCPCCGYDYCVKCGPIHECSADPVAESATPEDQILNRN